MTLSIPGLAVRALRFSPCQTDGKAAFFPFLFLYLTQVFSYTTGGFGITPQSGFALETVTVLLFFNPYSGDDDLAPRSFASLTRRRPLLLSASVARPLASRPFFYTTSWAVPPLLRLPGAGTVFFFLLPHQLLTIRRTSFGHYFRGRPLPPFPVSGGG